MICYFSLRLRTAATKEIESRQETRFILRSLQQQELISKYSEPNSSWYFRRQDFVPVNAGIVSNHRKVLWQIGKKYLSLRTATLSHSAFMNSFSLPGGRNSCHPKNSSHPKTQQWLYINCWLSSFLSIKRKREIKYFKPGQIGLIFFCPNISRNKCPSRNSFGM